jgi:hypothetical protein
MAMSETDKVPEALKVRRFMGLESDPWLQGFNGLLAALRHRYVSRPD